MKQVPNFKNSCRFFLCSVFLIVVFLGCSKNKLTHQESCDLRYEKLNAKYEAGKYAIIRDPLNDLLSTCTGSGFIEKALYQLATSHFKLEEWLEAQIEYTNLLNEFPSSKYAEEAQFNLAICNKQQILSINRDQSKTKEAVETFQTFVKLYPRSDLVDSARQFIFTLRKQLAQKELNIAKLYYKMNEYQSAAIYYKAAVDEFSNVLELKEVYLQLAKCYIEMKQFEQASHYLDNFADLKKEHPFYPDFIKVKNHLKKTQGRVVEQREKAAKSTARPSNL